MSAEPTPFPSAGAAGGPGCVRLNDGAEMPSLGLGVWQAGADAATEKVVCQAIEVGYRSFDTARLYGNERGVGAAIRACGLAREEIFVTTKVWTSDVRAGRVVAAAETSLRRLGCDYLDLFLVHWPVAGHIRPAWEQMESLRARGLARSIGVSNHLPGHLEELLAGGGHIPAVNQIEFHPYLQSKALLEFCRARKIQVEAWSPLMQGGNLLRDPVLQRLARSHGKTVAQVILRWAVQREVVVIPKTVHRDRMVENAGIFDFSLSPAEMGAIDALDRDERSGADPAQFPF